MSVFVFAVEQAGREVELFKYGIHDVSRFGVDQKNVVIVILVQEFTIISVILTMDPVIIAGRRSAQQEIFFSRGIRVVGDVRALQPAFRRFTAVVDPREGFGKFRDGVDRRRIGRFGF